MSTLRSVLLVLIAVVRFAINLVGYVAALAYLVLFAFEFFHAPRIESTRVVVEAGHLLAPSIHKLSGWFGWHWPRAGAPNFAPLILAIVVLFVRSFVEGLILRLDYLLRRVAKAQPRRRLDAAGAAQAAAASRYSGTAESEQQRAALLKRYREIEDSLKSSERKLCTFLSIDVVGSTKMKVGERETAIAATFQAYEEMVKSAFADYGMWKATWTPDGVMAAFLDRELALRTAQHVLTSLDAFNRHENHLRTPFKVRCGLNEGEVVIYEDSALEKVSDHSIDIAGHMQKYADEDTLLVSDVLYNKLGNPPGFVSTGREVDGFQTYAWTPSAESTSSEP
ncbi:MAG: hypothetical protein KGN02_05840 [bacterium]|nr:hypothetical protein [bacterium]